MCRSEERRVGKECRSRWSRGDGSSNGGPSDLAYAVKPQFLLMDEPFGALDAQTRANMQNLLLNVLSAEGKTVMLITHSVEEAIYLASRIVVVTARPARIKEIIDVPFAYPRDESLQERAEFVELRSRIRQLVMSEYRAQQAQIQPVSLWE